MLGFVVVGGWDIGRHLVVVVGVIVVVAVVGIDLILAPART